MVKNCDFSGWATRNNIVCSDGRTIKKDAFIEQDGAKVPLVWNHNHNSVNNVLGHALLENRDEGVYAYCSFNNTASAKDAKEMVSHGDITSLSIYANKLKQNGKDVTHGTIREVSLVLAGANPGAYIESIISHDDEEGESANIFNSSEELIMHSDEEQEAKEETEEVKSEKNEEIKVEETEEIKEKTEEDKTPLTNEEKTLIVEEVKNTLFGENGEFAHSDLSNFNLDSLTETQKQEYDKLSDEEKEIVHSVLDNNKEIVKHADEQQKEETIGDVYESLTEKQKRVVSYIIGHLLAEGNENIEHSNNKEDNMKENVFDSNNENKENVLTHAEMQEVFAEAKKNGSLKEAFLAHGITDITNLYPEYQAVNKTPELITRDMDWVAKVINNVHKVPFTKIKGTAVNLTADEARAKGYVKGTKKVEEVIVALKRTTEPTTIYKLQKLDRDDVLDITDFDVVAFLKQEMRTMLHEELARAILTGDGRTALAPDKVDPTKIRPIWQDNSVYAVQKSLVRLPEDTDYTFAKNFIKQVIKSRKDYKGSGNPSLFTTEDMLTNMLLIEDTNGRVIYDTEEKLRTALRVKEIITVPVMENLVREGTGTDAGYNFTLLGILVNLADYSLGNNKGGEDSFFEDFDLNYNKQEYLIETRRAGALTKPYSAIVFEEKTTAEQIEG